MTCAVEKAVALNQESINLPSLFLLILLLLLIYIFLLFFPLLHLVFLLLLLFLLFFSSPCFPAHPIILVLILILLTASLLHIICSLFLLPLLYFYLLSAIFCEIRLVHVQSSTDSSQHYMSCEFLVYS